MARSPIVIIGGGGHCLTIAGVIDAEGKWEIAGFVDPDGAAPLAKLGVPWLGDDDTITDLSIEHAHVGIGQIKSSKKREAIYERLIKSDIELPVIVAPSAYVASTADIGHGTLVVGEHHTGKRLVIAQQFQGYGIRGVGQRRVQEGIVGGHVIKLAVDATGRAEEGISTERLIVTIVAHMQY